MKWDFPSLLGKSILPSFVTDRSQRPILSYHLHCLALSIVLSFLLLCQYSVVVAILHHSPFQLLTNALFYCQWMSPLPSLTKIKYSRLLWRSTGHSATNTRSNIDPINEFHVHTHIVKPIHSTASPVVHSCTSFEPNGFIFMFLVQPCGQFLLWWVMTDWPTTIHKASYWPHAWFYWSFGERMSYVWSRKCNE